MNKVELVGRIVRDPEVRYSTGENATAIARFSVAVQRKFKNAEGNYEADFPSCTAFGKTAEFVEKWFHRGDMIGLTGHIQTGSYTNQKGDKVYTTDVMVDEVEFVGSKGTSNQSTGNQGEASAQRPSADSFMNIPDNIDDEADLPF